ncbi:unnamed protein product [Penicillium discolor]
MALGVAYGIWGASGVALTALLSLIIFGEPLTLLMGIGIVVVIAGVLGRVMVWLFLIGAIVFEVVGTLSLRMAVDKKRWYVGVAVGYVLAFTMLSLALAGGMALGVAYGIWAASGVALTAILSKFLFKEPFTWLMGLGIVLIVGGVLCIELGAVH